MDSLRPHRSQDERSSPVTVALEDQVVTLEEPMGTSKRGLMMLTIDSMVGYEQCKSSTGNLCGILSVPRRISWLRRTMLSRLW
ncbi:hypothetical protein Goklo_029168 [Gossypium klotzschianum]|uniref:Uncharacterized protein n=1 Tax=Gossypium klotzschianum TaxID=34286 RepID=A0A7J8WCK7_9ROSI|nr:hypothetical protein [Gossypium klotzschianum]